MKIEIKKLNPEFMTIDKSGFKYYLSLELDKVAEKYIEKFGESEFITQMMNEAYFNISERFAPMFREAIEEDIEEE